MFGQSRIEKNSSDNTEAFKLLEKLAQLTAAFYQKKNSNLFPDEV